MSALTAALGPRGSATRSPRGAWRLVVIGMYSLAAAYVAHLARDRINPDAIAYIQNARHYAAGRFNLAVSGWWGPLISWLLVPGAWLGGNMILWFRGINALCGIVLAEAAARLTGKMVGTRWTRAVYVAALLLSLRSVGDEITPDLLAAAALAWYFCAAYGLLSVGLPSRSPSSPARDLLPEGEGSAITVGWAFAVGVLGGLCYLTKAYAVMFVAGHLTITFLFRWRLMRRSASLAAGRASTPAARRALAGAVLREWGAAMAGMALAALPWAVVVSRQAGRPCLSTIGRCFYSWGPLPTDKPLPVHLLQDVTPGRITNWENPVEIPHPWGKWDVAGPGDWAWKMTQTIGINAWWAVKMVLRFDLLGLLFLGWAAGLLAPLARRLWRRVRVPRLRCEQPCGTHDAMNTCRDESSGGSLRDPHGRDGHATHGRDLSSEALAKEDAHATNGDALAVGVLWACVSVAFYVSGFLPIWIVSRYLWSLWGLLLPIFACILTMIARVAAVSAASTAGVPPADSRNRHGRWADSAASALAAALIFSLAANAILYVFVDDLGPLKKGREASWLRQVAETTGIKGAICTNKLGKWQDDNWYRGLFVTYWTAGEKGSQARFLGQFEGREPNSVRDQLVIPMWTSKPLLSPRVLSTATVLIFDDPELTESLLRHPDFRRTTAPLRGDGPHRVDVLEFDVFYQFRPQPLPTPVGLELATG